MLPMGLCQLKGEKRNLITIYSAFTMSQATSHTILGVRKLKFREVK